MRFLLLQTRNPDDPMKHHEIASFARALEVHEDKISIFDLLSHSLETRHLKSVDMLLLGGSGHYSAAGDGEWLDRALDSLRLVHQEAKPTFASCWGFQAMARAMGGDVVHDLSRAEIGTHRLWLTEAGKTDPVFGPLSDVFYGQMGHEDIVTKLPPDAVLLAYSQRVENQAYCFPDRPIYCTQFHPELNCGDLLERVINYPEYIRNIAGMEPEEFTQLIHETPQTEALLKRFVQTFVLGERGASAP